MTLTFQPPVAVNIPQPDQQSEEAIAALSFEGAARFAVVWRAGVAGSGETLDFRIFDAGGMAETAPQQLNNVPGDDLFEPQLAPLEDGGAMALWVRSNGLGESRESTLVARVIAPDGTLPGDERIVSVTVDAVRSDLAPLPGGGTLAAWSAEGGETGRVFVAELDAVANTDRIEEVRSAFVGDIVAPAAIALAEGGRLVAWTQGGGFANDDDGNPVRVPPRLIYATRDADGTVYSQREILVDAPRTTQPQLAALESGGALIGYSTRLEGNVYAGFVRAVDANGAPLGTVRLDLRAVSDLASLPDGRVLAVGEAQGGGMAGQLLTVEGALDGGSFAIASGPDFEGGGALSVLGDGTVALAFEAETAGSFDPVDGSRDDEVYLTVALPEGRLITGTPGTDRLTGTDGNDTIRALDGTDTLNGLDGDDVLFGGATDADPRDVILGGAGNDEVNAGYGNDLVYGQEGNDTIAGGFGADDLRGQEDDDVITGGALSDLVFGGDGNDFVNGGFGYDRINGGHGADRFFHLGVGDHGSDWVQDFDTAEGDVLVFGQTATADQFQINLAHTATPDGDRSGDDTVQEAFVIYRPTGQIIWALVDGEGQDQINLQIGGELFDLLT